MSVSASFLRASFSKPLIHANQRRIRHVKCIMARNLRIFGSLSTHLPSCFFTLHRVVFKESITPLENLNSTKDGDSLIPNKELEGLFYTSEIIQLSLNPVWKHFQQDTFVTIDIQSIPIFLIKVWNWFGPNTPAVKMIEQLVDLRELHFIGNSLNSNLKNSFPTNSIVLELTDGFYKMDNSGVSGMLLQQISNEFSNALTINKMKTSPSFSKSDLAQILTVHKNVEVIESKTNELKKEISDHVEKHKRLSQMKQKRDIILFRVAELRKEQQRKMEEVKQERNLVDKKRSDLLPNAKKLSSAEISLLANKNMLKENKIKLEEDKKLLILLTKTCEERRWKLIKEMTSIYPIANSTDGKCLTINGFRLPNSDFTGCDEEQIATALGIVCHILLQVSKYLDVPLRYPMIPMCSRSVIRDDISQQTSPKFPLYSRGVDRTRFEYGVFLLNKNLEQLLNSLGKSVVTLRHTLPNLQVLMSRPERDP